MVDFISKTLTFFTLLGGILLIAILLYITARKLFGIKPKQPDNLLKQYGLLLAFLIALTSTIGSLFYSEIAQYAPCKLCWYQRILIYPQVVILGIALAKKYYKEVIDYCIALSIIGVMIATYQYYLQRFSISDTPCSAVDYSQSCSQNFILNIGYITIPMMAITAFLLIITFLLFARKK